MGNDLRLIQQVRALGADLRVHQGTLQIAGKAKIPYTLLRAITRKRQSLMFLLSLDHEQAAASHREKEDVTDSISSLPEKSTETPLWPRKKSFNKAENIKGSLKNFRRACAWLIPRLDMLHQGGWDNKSLFKIGKLAYPVFWGIAWSGFWLEAETIKLDSDGSIVFIIKNAPVIGGANTLVARPPGKKWLK